MHRTRSWKSIGTFALILLLALIISPSCGVFADDLGTYIRIKTGPKDYVYVEFKGKEMRMAPSAEALAQTEPLKAAREATHSGIRQIQFLNVALPVPLKQEPSPEKKQGLTPPTPKTRAYALFTVNSRRGRRDYTTIDIYHTTHDTEKAKWEYCQRLYPQPAKNVKTAHTVVMSDMKELALTINMQSLSSIRMGIAVQLASGKGASKAQLSDVRKNMKPVHVAVTLLDTDGKEVASKKGPLSDFAYG